MMPMVLILSVIIGAGYRSTVLKENYEERIDLGVFFSLASNFRTSPGGYSFVEYEEMLKNPDGYVYTNGKSGFEPNGSIENELGWSFILSFILKEGVRGVHNLALIIARYQIMIDLTIIILLFWVGRKIAGPMGAFLASLFYGIFKMAMVVMSWIGYYYWTIPFSALSLLFWVVVYQPENDKIKIRWKYLSFFLYGVLIGFATFVRLYFLFLPLFMAPLLFIRERSIKKGIALLLFILLGQSVFLVPQILITKKHFGRYALTTRGSWHLVVQGLGIYSNPWGIKDSGDLTVAAWAIDRGGPDLQKDGIEAYNKFLGKEVFKMFKEHPEIFFRNFKNNMIGGMAISPHFFQFFGIIDTVPVRDRLFKAFPWLILSAFFLLFIFSRNQFWIASAVFLQGLYLLLVVCTFFPSYIPFVAGYIPVFVLLLAIAVAVYIKTGLALIEGGIRCWIQGNGIKALPKMIVDCYREDWDKNHAFMENTGLLAGEQTLSEVQTERVKGSILKKMWSSLLVKLIGLFLVTVTFTAGIWFIYKNNKHGDVLQLMPDAYLVWNMDSDTKDNVIADSAGKYNAASFNALATEGHSGKASYFNGKDSYIQTPVDFHEWKGIAISLWVRPEPKDVGEISVILDNGHDAGSNFVIQSADIDPNSDRWIFHCNGADIFMRLPFHQWTRIVVIADAEQGVIRAYTNDVEAARVNIGRKFEFGAVPLTIGKLATADERYFKGSIDEVIIMDKVSARQ